MKRLLASALAAVSVGASASAQQGVTDTEILLGSHTALSGPLASWGQASLNAAELYFDGVNADGGINGRMIRLIREDHAYEVPKAAAAGEKLVIDDGIFAMFGALGTPQNNAVLPLQEEFGVPNVFPMTAARSMEGEIRFQGLSSYYGQIAAGARYFVNTMGASKPCLIYLETDFGREALDAMNDTVAELGLELAATSAQQPNTQDFAGVVLRFKREGCDFIALGTNFPEAMAIKATAAQLEFDVPIMGSTAILEEAVIYLGAERGILTALDGLYAAGAWISMADARDRSPAAVAWEELYLANSDLPIATGAAIAGRIGAEFVSAALANAGQDLTMESFVAAMETTSIENIFTGGVVEFGQGGRRGSDDVFLSRIQANDDDYLTHTWSLVEQDPIQ